MKKNETIHLFITDMGINGEGIGKADGFPFFVKNAVIGDEVLAVITQIKKGFGYAKALQILTPSPERVEPSCVLAQRCGGCQMMQLSYKAQLRFKEEKVKNDLLRIGKMKEIPLLPIIGMEPEEQEDLSFQPLHFRNKMQFPVGWDREGNVVTGFYAGRTHYIVAAHHCPVSPEVNDQILETVRSFIQSHRLSVYNEETSGGLIRHILIRNGFATGQIMVCLVINGETLRDNSSGLSGGKADPEQDLVAALTELTLPAPWKITSICLNSNMANTNVILGKDTRCLFGNPYIEEKIESPLQGMKALLFRINPRSFFQTNPRQTVKLYETALKFAGLTGKETVFDLYCGTGTISLFLASKARMVCGVEIIPEAILDAEANAARNDIHNARFYCGKAEEVFPEVQADCPADVVILDPPRKGCDRTLLETLRKTGPSRIVYVSCDPATLARDLRYLSGDEDASQDLPYRYRTECVQPVDMFPHTVHVEVVSLLQQVSNSRPKAITLDVEMEDYYRIKGDRTND